LAPDQRAVVEQVINALFDHRLLVNALDDEPHSLSVEKRRVYAPEIEFVRYAVDSPLGVGPSVLRQDRILDEARHTADPVHLMRVFGISVHTAMDYVYAAHPERRSAAGRP
jgi:hypothetical protein